MNKVKIDILITYFLLLTIIIMNYYDKIVNFKQYINNESLKKICNFCITNFGIYIVWVGIHYIAAHLYVYWCVPATLVGIFMSPFIVPRISLLCVTLGSLSWR